MPKRNRLLIAEVLLLLAALFVIAVRTVDVAAVGPNGTSVGFSRMNQAVFGATGYNASWYRVSKLLGYVSFLTASAFAVFGVIQAMRRRSLLAVDRRILALAGLYAAFVVIYAVFEKVVINYRPVIMPGDAAPKASFPSTHTMLACVVMGSAVMVLGHYGKNAALRRLLQAACAAVLIATVAARILAGVHWLSDILGALLISAALLALYAAACAPAKKR